MKPLLLLVIALFFLQLSCQNKNQIIEPQLFKLLTAEQTGITFQNTLEEAPNTNILMYEYFYNGGGVATGDFNNDGLIDAYFTSNMGVNKLYLNQGKMQFKDITDISGAGGRVGPWKTGINVVDINADGKLDIYLCYSGAMPTEKRVNQLFINQGNNANGIPQFIEKAAEFGLDSKGFSNQSYFFDYDKDGDLDMLLLNHNPKNLPLLNEQATAELFRTDDPERGLRLFKQTNQKFEDITPKSGINGSPLSYGLAVGLADFNQDGWLDFYLSNDYNVPDYLYINQQNGTFSNELSKSIGHTSQFSMGNDAADINNDGMDDVFTLDMLPEDNRRQKLLLAPDNFAKFDLNVKSGFYYQYMRNMLHINNGTMGSGVTFSEVGQIANISNTDWSWSALLADYDNDGWKDLFVSNGYNRDYTNLDFIKYMDDFVKEKGRLTREDVLEIIKKMPASNVVNYIFKNKNGIEFSNQTQNWGMNLPSNSNGAAYADLDNDGDLDLLVSNINLPAFVFQNESEKYSENDFLQVKLNGQNGNTQGIGSKVSIFVNGIQQSQNQTLTRGYLSSVSPILHFGIGEKQQIDSLKIVWSSGKQQTLKNPKINQILELNEANANEKSSKKPFTKPFFEEIPTPIAYENPKIQTNDFDSQLLLTTQFSHEGATIAKGDLNNDTLEDIFVGASAGQPSFVFIQQKNGNFSKKIIDPEITKTYGVSEIFDTNNDGFQDILVATESGEIINYLNDGKGNFTKKQLPFSQSNPSCMAIEDINSDGKIDFFMGGNTDVKNYPQCSNSFVYLNSSSGSWNAIDLGKIGLVKDAVWADLDNDRKKELIVVGEWMPIMVFGYENAKMVEKTDLFFVKKLNGWWNTIEIGDFNKDNKPDLIVGNWGLNSQVRATDTEPTEIYFKDFDKNGSLDPILCFYIQKKSYPYLTRDELLNQINGFRAKYPTFESYASATIEDIFGSDLWDAGHLEANHLTTTLFLSTSSGKYSVENLPIQAQFSSVHAISIFDFDNDGNHDILLAGNHHYPKIRLGQMDANFGCLLKGDGKGKFEFISQPKSGFNLSGDVRKILKINDLFIFGINESKIRAYRKK